MEQDNNIFFNKYGDPNQYPILVNKAWKSFKYAVLFLIISIIFSFIAPLGMLISIPICLFSFIRLYIIGTIRKKLIDKENPNTH